MEMDRDVQHKMAGKTRGGKQENRHEESDRGSQNNDKRIAQTK